MSKSSDLINKRSKYYAFKENLNTLAIQMKAAIDEFNTPISQVRENYIVEEESGDKEKLKSIQSSINEKYNLLNQYTIPAVEAKINSLTREIENALKEEAEEEERKREEEMRSGV